MWLEIMEVNQRKLDALKCGVETLALIAQDLVKFTVYITILVGISSVVFQYGKFLYGWGPSISGFNDKYISKRSSDVGIYAVKDVGVEKHFGHLLPTEYLAEVNQQNLVNERTISENLLSRRTESKSSNVRDAKYEEALMAVRKARQMASSGNKKLATKLFQHALALDPQFVDALTMYGEFLEDDNNIMQADMLYQRALTFEPSHTTALTNRERTMPLVEELDKNILTDIDRKKSELYKLPPHNNALRRAMKEFYYQHIYHTVALEGNTLTIEEIREIINSRRAVSGRSIYEHNEVIGVDEALKYLNNTLLLTLGSVSVDQIKDIHKRVVGYVDPVNAGVFRSNQVFVGKHIPPHPSLVPQYMSEFNEWLNSEEAHDLHPVEFAALAHYKLVYVHPFIDGNGRTSRLLMNFILMKHGFPPVSIQVNDRWEYYESLEAANEGDVRPFVRFIARCVSFTLDDYLIAAQDAISYPELQGPYTHPSNVIETPDDER